MRVVKPASDATCGRAQPAAPRGPGCSCLICATALVPPTTVERDDGHHDESHAAVISRRANVLSRDIVHTCVAWWFTVVASLGRSALTRLRNSGTVLAGGHGADSAAAGSDGGSGLVAARSGRGDARSSSPVPSAMPTPVE
jgi:hypothetical protein